VVYTHQLFDYNQCYLQLICSLLGCCTAASTAAAAAATAACRRSNGCCCYCRFQAIPCVYEHCGHMLQQPGLLQLLPHFGCKARLWGCSDLSVCL
jgi:hypothetical protein